MPHKSFYVSLLALLRSRKNHFSGPSFDRSTFQAESAIVFRKERKRTERKEGEDRSQNRANLSPLFLFSPFLIIQTNLNRFLSIYETKEKNKNLFSILEEKKNGCFPLFRFLVAAQVVRKYSVRGGAGPAADRGKDSQQNNLEC